MYPYFASHISAIFMMVIVWIKNARQSSTTYLSHAIWANDCLLVIQQIIPMELSCIQRWKTFDFNHLTRHIILKSLPKSWMIIGHCRYPGPTGSRYDFILLSAKYPLKYSISHPSDLSTRSMVMFGEISFWWRYLVNQNDTKILRANETWKKSIVM